MKSKKLEFTKETIVRLDSPKLKAVFGGNTGDDLKTTPGATCGCFTNATMRCD